MIAKSAFDVLQRIGLPEKADRGHFDLGLQLTCGASTCEAEMPARIVIFHGSPVVFQTILKVMLAGVAMDSRAGQRGWSTTGMFCISSVKVLPSGLMVRPCSGTGTTQSSPDSEFGG